MKLPDLPWLIQQRRTAQLFDDFWYYNSAEVWTSLAADAGVTAPAHQDKHGGRISMATGATDNNEVGVFSTKEIALFQDNASFIFEARIQFTEANTDDANVCVGMAQEAAANILQDNGGGPAATMDGVLIYKIDGETVWRSGSSKSTTQSLKKSTKTAGGASFQTLRIEGRVLNTTDMEFSFYVDGEQLVDTNGVKLTSSVAYASMGEMELIAGYIKAGGANSETLVVDYVAYGTLRP